MALDSRAASSMGGRGRGNRKLAWAGDSIIPRFNVLSDFARVRTVVETNGGIKAWLTQLDGSRTPIGLQCSVGRSEGNTLVLRDERVSRRHAMIQAQGKEGYLLVDLGSINGTYLNGRRVTLPSVLAHRDIIEIGSWRLVFECPEPPPSVPEEPATTDATLHDVRSVACWLLVADMEDSTQMIRKRTPREAAMLTGQWLSTCRDLVEQAGGAINKFLGDGFFAYWTGDGRLVERVTTALVALRRVQRAENPRFRMALHFGTVYVGGASLGEDNLAGPEVNFVFRMEKVAAEMGQPLLVSQTAGELLKEYLPLVAAGETEVRGFEGVHCFYGPAEA